MERYAEGTSLTCATVSPTMMEQVMRLNDDAADKDIRQMLRSLKSCRIASDKIPDEVETLFAKAIGLMHSHAGRYKLYDEYDGKQLYMRWRNKTIVEVVLLTKTGGVLTIVDLTGIMDEAFVKRLTAENEMKR